MPIPFIGALIAKPMAALGTFAAVAVIGFGGGVAWEHRGEVKIPVVGWLLGKSLKVQRDAFKAAAHEMEFNEKWGRNAWRKEALGARAAIADRDDKLRKCGMESGVSIEEARSFWKGQSLAAFNAGRATCGARNAKPSPSGGGAGGKPAAGELRDDFRSEWARGAFRPAGPAADGVPR